MKKLLLCRHAKSSWDDPFISDQERPLAKRGLRDSPVMAQRLKKKNILPDLIISSDAKRAEATALIVAENLHYPKEKIEVSPKLYHAPASSLLFEICKTPSIVDILFLFGHNPAITDLIEILGGDMENLPTCGQFGFMFEVENWREINKKNAQVWFFDYPKKDLS